MGLIPPVSRQTTFDYFRYQIIPKSSKQLTIFDTQAVTLTVEELKEKKNEYFLNAVSKENLLFLDSHKDELKHRVISNIDNIVVFKLGRPKSIVITNEKLEEEEHLDFPNITVILDNDPANQKIAISRDVDSFSNSFVVANNIVVYFKYKSVLELKGIVFLNFTFLP